MKTALGLGYQLVFLFVFCTSGVVLAQSRVLDSMVMAIISNSLRNLQLFGPSYCRRLGQVAGIGP